MGDDIQMNLNELAVAVCTGLICISLNLVAGSYDQDDEPSDPMEGECGWFHWPVERLLIRKNKSNTVIVISLMIWLKYKFVRCRL